jgi:hypothetical protein
MCWALWLNKNAMLFNKKKNINSFLQVIFSGTYWIRQWSQSSKEEERAALKSGCKQLESDGAKNLWKTGLELSDELRELDVVPFSTFECCVLLM